MTLREMAYETAREICKHSLSQTHALPDIADAIERVAKAFAEEAIRKYTNEIDCVAFQQDIAASIAAAERGE